MRHRAPKRLTLVSALAALMWLGCSAPGVAAKRCVDLFSRAVAESARGSVEASYPVAGVTRGADGRYKLRLGDDEHEGVSATALASKLAAALDTNLSTGARPAPLSIYFENLTPQEAYNFVSTVRLKSATPRRPVQGIAAGGGSKPPAYGSASAVAGGDPPSDGHGSGMESDGGREPWRALAFKPAFKRYDWSKATVAPLAIAPPIQVPGPRLAFQITVPPAPREARGVSFKLWIMWPGRKAAPTESAVGARVSATLKEEALQQAAVQEAAARLKARLASTYPGSRTALATDLGDLTIVELEPLPDAAD